MLASCVRKPTGSSQDTKPRSSNLGNNGRSSGQVCVSEFPAQFVLGMSILSYHCYPMG